MRKAPNMTVLFQLIARGIFNDKVGQRYKGPVYIRLAREKSAKIFTDEYSKIDLDKPEVVFSSSESKKEKSASLATGPILFITPCWRRKI